MNRVDQRETWMDGFASPSLDTAKRQQIMDGARQVFLEHGFDGASVGDIVRAAGVSKGTIYAYFPSKEKLFETMIIEDRRKQAEVLFTMYENDIDELGVEAALRHLGMSFLEMLLTPDTMALLRIVIAAAPKFPEAGKAFYTAGPCLGSQRLGDYFRKLDADGVLNVADPEHAARQFLDLCKTGLHVRMLLGDDTPPTDEEKRTNVDAAIHVFMAAYAAR